MSKKGENIYKRKDGRWEGRYVRFYDENRKAKYGYIYGKTYNDVKQRLLEKKALSAKQKLYLLDKAYYTTTFWMRGFNFQESTSRNPLMLDIRI